MNRSRASVLLTLALLLGHTLGAYAAEPKKIVLIATPNDVVQEEITLDGNLDEPMWKGAVKLTGFKAAGDEETVVLLVCDRLDLYAGVICKQPVAEGESVVFVLKAEIDETVKLPPPMAEARRREKQRPPARVEMSREGKMKVVDLRVAAASKLRPAGGVAAGDGEWRAELRIPLAAFGAIGHDSVWLMNVVRKQAGASVVWSGEQAPRSGDNNLGKVEFRVSETVLSVAMPRAGGSRLPKVNGVLDEAMWQHGGVINLYPTRGVRMVRTDCRFVQRGTKMYFSATCYDAPGSKKHGGGTESLSVYLYAGDRDKTVFKISAGHFSKGGVGVKSVGGEGVEWPESKRLKVVQHRPRKGLWKLEIEIPKRALRLRRGVVPNWRVNVVRRRGSAVYAWAGGQGYEDPELFGKLGAGGRVAAGTATDGGGGGGVSVVRLPDDADAPGLDGVADDACWEKAPAAGTPQTSSSRKPAKPTVIKAIYDDQFLYLLMQCNDAQPMPPVMPRMTMLLAKADNDKEWFEIVVNLDGKVEAEKKFHGSGMPWEGADTIMAKVGQAEAEKVVTFELAVPLEVLGEGAVTQKWRVNFVRQTAGGSFWLSGERRLMKSPKGCAPLTFMGAK